MDLLRVFVFALIFVTATCDDDLPPKVPGSFIAKGEIIQYDEEQDSLFQLTFEENYDSESEISSFEVLMDGQHMRMYHSIKKNETLVVDPQNFCQSANYKDWNLVHLVPDLEMIEETGGDLAFPLKQLFLLDTKYLVKEPLKKVEFRDSAAYVWKYHIEKISEEENTSCSFHVISYWSSEEMKTTSNESTMPLGLEVNKICEFTNNRTVINSTSGTVNLFYFMNNTYNRYRIQFPELIYCKDRKPSIPFPDFSEYEVFSYHSEFVDELYQEFRSADLWLDGRNGFLRADFDSLYYENTNPLITGQPATTIIGNAKQNALYIIDRGNGDTCKIIKPDEFDYDPQILVDVTNTKKWKINEMMGSWEADYKYVHKDLKRGGVPCNLFQGKRAISTSVTGTKVDSIWEWCIANVSKNGQEKYLPLTLDVQLMRDKIDIMQKFPYYSYEIYHFKREDINVLESTKFDISPCFPSKLQLMLEFELDIRDPTFKRESVNANFIATCKQGVYEAAGLSPYSLRIVKGQVKDYGMQGLFLQFIILDLHPDLPKEAKKDDDIELYHAVHNLNDTIRNGSYEVFWSPTGEEPMPIRAVNNTLRNVLTTRVAPTGVPTTSATSPSSDDGKTTSNKDEKSTNDGKQTSTDGHTTSSHDGKRTSADDYTTNSQVKNTSAEDKSTPDGKKKTTPSPIITTSSPINKSGFSPGSLAGLAIGMLLIGISLGAGGTFAKFRFFS